MRFIGELAGTVVFAMIAGFTVGRFNINPDDVTLIKYAILVPAALLGFWVGGKVYDKISKA